MDIENNSMETLEKVKEKLTNEKVEKKEGKLAKYIESKTSKLPTDIFLWTSLGAVAASLTLKVLQKEKDALFVGLWTAPILLMGVYNKLVKLHGSER